MSLRLPVERKIGLDSIGHSGHFSQNSWLTLEKCRIGNVQNKFKYIYSGCS